MPVLFPKSAKFHRIVFENGGNLPVLFLKVARISGLGNDRCGAVIRISIPVDA